jgi:[ribosomal protein S5]-alanine N-acetyltransferase
MPKLFLYCPMKRIIETDRLYFRAFEPGDEAIIYQLNSNPVVVQYTGNPPMPDLADAHRVLHEHLLPQYALHLGRWAVHLKDQDQFIGWCGLKQTEAGIDLGYRYLPDQWGKGYGLEAAKATLDYGFNTLDLKRIIAHVVVENQASMRILERIGMHKTALVKEKLRTIQKFEMMQSDFGKGN